MYRRQTGAETLGNRQFPTDVADISHAASTLSVAAYGATSFASTVHDDVVQKPCRFRHRLRRYYSTVLPIVGGERSLNLFRKSQSSEFHSGVPKWDRAWYMAFSRCDSGDNWNRLCRSGIQPWFGHQCRTFGDFGDPIINMLHAVISGARIR